MKNSTNNSAIDQFIIEASLIDPIQKIINQLNNYEFRDCDIKWLDAKIEKFTQFACNILGIQVVMPINSQDKTLNDFVLSQYVNHFNTLLNYFKSI